MLLQYISPRFIEPLEIKIVYYIQNKYIHLILEFNHYRLNGTRSQKITPDTIFVRFVWMPIVNLAVGERANSWES